MTRIIRQFELIEQIGTGSMGIIWRAVQTTLDRRVAVKELHPILAKDQEFLVRFEREAKTAATLHHDNIVGVIDYGQEQETYFLALEFVEGTNLEDLLAESGPMPASVVASLALDMLAGLDHAHGRGVIHRDMKPANVMVTAEDGIAKIADFSIAQAAQMPSITQTGAMMGTPAYMSPEQVGGKALDVRTDLFSLGIILYELISGERPFQGDSYPTIISNLLNHNPKSLAELDPMVPDRLSEFVDRCLKKDPDERFASAAEAMSGLSAAIEADAIPTPRSAVAKFIADPKAARDELQRAEARAALALAMEMSTRGSHGRAQAFRAVERAHLLDPTDAEAARQYDSLKKHRRKATARVPKVRKPRRQTAILIAVTFIIFAGIAISSVVLVDQFRKYRASGIDGESTHTTTLMAEATATEVSMGDYLPTETSANAVTTATPEKTRRPRKTPRGGVTGRSTPGATPAASGTRVSVAATVAPKRTPVGPGPSPADRTAELRFAFDPPGGTLTVDRKPVRIGDALDLAPGTYKVEMVPARADIYKTYRQTVTLQEGDRRQLRVRMEPIPGRGVGFLDLQVKPFGDVYEDNIRLGDAPQRFKLESGRHRLTIKNPRCKDRTITVDIVPGKTESVPVNLSCSK